MQSVGKIKCSQCGKTGHNKRSCKQRHGPTPGASGPTAAATSPAYNVPPINDPSSQNPMTVSKCPYW